MDLQLVYIFKTVVRKCEKRNITILQHINNSVKVKPFGAVNIQSQLDKNYNIAIKRHNDLVDKCRHCPTKL